MRNKRKKPSVDLRKYYTIFLQSGLIVVLLTFIVAMKMQFMSKKQDIDLTQEQEVTKMKEVIQTKQEKTPPPPPRPQVPVEVPNDQVIKNQNIDISADINMDQPLDMPPPPEEKKENDGEDFFVAVEQMPKLKGGQKWLYNHLKYPDMAKKAGIEGRVIIQFIVTASGHVKNAKVLRGIGGGCDKAALNVIRKATFNPGKQRGKPVAVQMAQTISFRLKN
ncbi:MAG TPA: TonB family protein [Balneolaceae bacterium]|nr:TonB family protein [Balneolaceae bacterium]